jgi:hypothetical protein
LKCHLRRIRALITDKPKPKIDAGDVVGYLWKVTDGFIVWLEEFINSNQKAKLTGKASPPDDFQKGYLTILEVIFEILAKISKMNR